MRLQEIMSTNVVSIGPDETADTAWTRMRNEGIRHLVVQQGRRLLGVLSDRDLGGHRGSELRRGRTVRELMSERVATAKSGTTLRQAANLMGGRLIGSLPVVDDGRVIGIVTATDVLDELGRGSTRPAVQAKRKDIRLPPASARSARRKSARKRPRSTKRSKEGEGLGAEPPAGRERVREPESPGRAPFARRVARPDKRTAGRTPASEIPAFIRAPGAALDAADKEYLRRKLGLELGKFAHSIERVSVRVDDVNGPRGGVDKRCRIKVVLSGLPSAFVESRDVSMRAAMDGALARAERSVRQTVQRRRTVPRSARRSPVAEEPRPFESR